MRLGDELHTDSKMSRCLSDSGGRNVSNAVAALKKPVAFVVHGSYVGSWAGTWRVAVGAEWRLVDDGEDRLHGKVNYRGTCSDGDVVRVVDWAGSDGCEHCCVSRVETGKGHCVGRRTTLA